MLAAALGCGVQEHPLEQQDVGLDGPIYQPPPAAGGVAGAGTPVGPGGAAGAGGVGVGAGVGVGGASLPGGGAASAGAPVTAGAGGASGGVSGAAATAGGAGSPAAAGASGILVNINGTMLPKEDVIGFVHVGHSNMAGRATSPATERPYFFTDVNLRAWEYRANVWQPALEPTADPAARAGTMYGGPGTALIKQAVEMAPSRYFVSLGFGRGSAYCSQFLPGGLYYDQVMAAPKALKGKITFAAIVVMLGITERHGTSGDINGYANCINTLVTAIRTDLAEPTLPVLVTDYEMQATGAELSPTGAFATSIIPQIRMIPTVVSNSALVPTDGIAMQDDHHFNLAGHREWTRRVLTIMREKGWFRWAP